MWQIHRYINIYAHLPGALTAVSTRMHGKENFKNKSVYFVHHQTYMGRVGSDTGLILVLYRSDIGLTSAWYRSDTGLISVWHWSPQGVASGWLESQNDLFEYIHTHTQYIHTNIRTYIHHTHMHTYIHTHIYIHTNIRTYIYHTYVRTYIHHTHIYTHTYTHTRNLYYSVITLNVSKCI
jgi:hypothetical protein